MRYRRKDGAREGSWTKACNTAGIAVDSLVRIRYISICVGARVLTEDGFGICSITPGDNSGGWTLSLFERVK